MQLDYLVWLFDFLLICYPTCTSKNTFRFNFLTFEGDVFMGAAAILSNLIILVVVALEFVVAALQTYVFMYSQLFI
jgi:hypothetical protein